MPVSGLQYVINSTVPQGSNAEQQARAYQWDAWASTRSQWMTREQAEVILNHLTDDENGGS